MKKSIDYRLWERVVKTEYCWNWTGARTPRGYGKIYFSGKCVYVHRLSYEFTYGVFSKELDVLHRCDNPPCVNPNHLFLGTAKDNSQDMMIKGRHRIIPLVGERNGNSIMLEEEVIQLLRVSRDYEDAGERKINEKLSKIFGISKVHVKQIRRNKTWKHLDRTSIKNLP